MSRALRVFRASAVLGLFTVGAVLLFEAVVFVPMGLIVGFAETWEGLLLIWPTQLPVAGLVGVGTGVVLATVGRQDGSGLPDAKQMRFMLAIGTALIFGYWQIPGALHGSLFDVIMVVNGFVIGWLVSGNLEPALRTLLRRGEQPELVQGVPGTIVQGKTAPEPAGRD